MLRASLLSFVLGAVGALLVLSTEPRQAWAQSVAVEGRVLDAETGAPIVDVNVLALGEGGTRVGASTNAEGRFRIEGLSTGTYQIQATAIGYEPSQERIRVTADRTPSVELELEAQAYELNEIVVSSARARASSSSTVQRVSASDIERQDPADVSEVGRLIPAAHVQTNSRGQTLLYLRDAGERQVAQFFDGALLNVPWDNRVDIGVFPAAMLGGVTVSKGVPSVRYGANVLGGAVNFQSRSFNQQGSRTEVRGAVGTPQSGRASVTHMGRRGAFSYTGSLGLFSQDDFALPQGTNLPHSQPSGDRRTNTDRRFANGFLRGTYQLADGSRLGISALHVDAEKGVAPESHVDPGQERVRYWRYPVWRKTMLIASGDILLGEETHLRGAVWGSRFEQDIYQHESVAYERLRETQGDLDYTAGLRLVLEQSLGPGGLDLSLNALTTRHRQENTPYEEGGPASDSLTTYRQHLFSLGTEYEVPLGDRLEMTLGASLDGSAITDTGPWEAEGYDHYAKSAISVTAGLAYELSERLTWRAAAGRKGRFPTMRELFGGALGKFVPNPDLRPVTAFIGETGLAWGGSRYSGEVTAFLNRTYDALDQRTIREGPDAGKDQRINLDGSRVYGVEAVGVARPAEGLSLDGHLTWMRPRGFVEGEVQKLGEKPAWLGTVTATYDLPLGFSLMLQSEYMGGAYARTRVNAFDRLPDALVFDARLSYAFMPSESWFASGEVFIRVNNITDELRLLQLGLPGPGREFRLGFKAAF